MKIFFLGDIGNFNKTSKIILKNIKEEKKEDDIIILLGDNFYPFGVNSKNDLRWNFIDQYEFKNLYAILGNHDYLGNIKCQIEHDKWIMEKHYFSKKFDSFEIFFLDTNILVPDYSNLNYNIVKSKINVEPLEESKKQLDWLSEELSKTNKLKIVVGHYPIFSFGMYGINKKLFDLLFPIFRKYNVDLYVSGHDHNLQIIDIITNDFNFKQIVSGAGSCLYPILKNCSNKVFSKNGYITFDTINQNLNIVDTSKNIIYSENYKKN